MFNEDNIRKFISLCLGIFTASSMLVIWNQIYDQNNKQSVIWCDKLNLRHKFKHIFIYKIQNLWKRLNQHLFYKHLNKPNKFTNRKNNSNDIECK